MQVGFYVPRCSPENSHGRYVIELAKRLVGDHEVTIYSGAFSQEVPALAACRHLPVVNRPALARILTLWATSSLAAKLRGTPIVHTQGADAPVGTIVTAQFCNAAFRGKDSGLGGTYRSANRRIGVLAEQYCMSKASTRRIIAISQQVKRDIEHSYGVEPSRVVVIPHGVDTEIFHPRQRDGNRGKMRARLGLTEQHFVVLFVGGDYRRKGLMSLLKALTLTDHSTRLLAVGLGPDRTLARLISDLRIGDRVGFIGTNSNMPALYGAADCYALPTAYDTFSMATLEAMAAGLPVIVSRAAGVTEILQSGKDALITEGPESVPVLAHHLERLRHDLAVRSKLGSEARRTAERHSWAVVANQTVAVYEQVNREQTSTR